jgi:hypothetical protein
MERMKRYVVEQVAYDRADGRRLKTKVPMWSQGSPPKPEELDYLVKAARKRRTEAQRTGAIEFQPTLTISKEKAIKIGELPITYYKRTQETIDIDQELILQ